MTMEYTGPKAEDIEVSSDVFEGKKIGTLALPANIQRLNILQWSFRIPSPKTATKGRRSCSPRLLRTGGSASSLLERTRKVSW